jgi:cytochrome c oxidase subunit 4
MTATHRPPAPPYQPTAGATSLKLSDEARREFLARMRPPLLSFATLLVFLGVIIALGQLFATPAGSWIEVGVTVCMAITVLLVSMEVVHEPPLMRLFSAVGFVWVAILFGMTMVDYFTR